MSASLTFADFSLEAVWGDLSRFDITITVRDSDGVAQPAASISGWTLYFYAKTNLDDLDAASVFNFDTTNDPNNLAIVSASSRTARLTLLAADFTSLVEKDVLLYCDLRGLTGSGELVTLARGTLTIQ